MTYHDYFLQKEYEFRTERLQRAIRSRDGARARTAWLRKRASEERIR